MNNKSTFGTSAYGGEGWQPRESSHAHEIGKIWGLCGIDSEWRVLKSVILHRPGRELEMSLDNPDQVQMLDSVDCGKAMAEHDQMVEAYRNNGVEVELLHPAEPVSPNQMFCADLFAMTPQGAILGRPASAVRAGEEVEVARCLANLGVPVLATLTGRATFEGADMIWINGQRALVGLGLRTNPEAAAQITAILQNIGIEVIAVDMPFGTMHLMGMLRIVDENRAIAWPRRTPHRAIVELQEAGYEVQFIPEHDEFDHGKGFNFVTLGPGKILMVGNNPEARDFYESLQIECIETPASELSKAAGAVGCLTGIVRRDVEAGG